MFENFDPLKRFNKKMLLAFAGNAFYRKISEIHNTKLCFD